MSSCLVFKEESLSLSGGLGPETALVVVGRPWAWLPVRSGGRRSSLPRTNRTQETLVLTVSPGKDETCRPTVFTRFTRGDIVLFSECLRFRLTKFSLSEH